jgi:uncharacterized protein
MYAEWCAASAVDPEAATVAFRLAKDRLFVDHPQSPLLPEDHPGFGGLAYWPYDRAWRMTVQLDPDEAAPADPGAEPAATAPSAPGTASALGPFAISGPIALPNSGSDAISFRRIGRVRLSGPLEGHSLSVFWIDAYGGGIFLPFRDGTSGTETYGAGRYLLDTIKSADHGGDAASGTLVLDFNLAYHPSCTYDPRWSCPLAPPENTLPLQVRIGERLRSAA